MPKPVQETEAETQAYRELAELARALDQIGEDVDAELAGETLRIEFPDGTQYVLNAQRALRQIWLAAKRLAWHFEWRPDRGRWVSAKSGEELWATVERLTSQQLGRLVILSQRP